MKASKRIMSLAKIASLFTKTRPVKKEIDPEDNQMFMNMLHNLCIIQDEISFPAGIKEVVEWIKANADLEHGDRDAGLLFEDYLHFDYDKWQAKLKEWGISET